jgi:rubredoxin
MTFAFIALFSLISLCGAFNPSSFRLGSAISARKPPQALPISSTVLAAKGKLTAQEQAEELGYWGGDWVCADCGYVYDIDFDGGGKYFEQQKKGFICPQCSAPRRRYAKKVGDEWGVTNDGGDFPIYFATFLGLAATTWFALVYVPTL